MRRDPKPKVPPRSTQQPQAPPPFTKQDLLAPTEDKVLPLSSSASVYLGRTYDHTGIADLLPTGCQEVHEHPLALFYRFFRTPHDDAYTQ